MQLFYKRDRAGRRAFAARLREVPVLDEQKFVLAGFVAARLIRRIDGFACDGIDKLVFEAIAGTPVHLPKGDSIGARNRGIERDRAGDEREFQIALPIRACAGNRHSNATTKSGR